MSTYTYRGTQTSRYPSKSPTTSQKPSNRSGFADAVRASLENEMTTTENGMPARKHTANAVLGFFSKAGSSRGKSLATDFSAALAENEQLAVRALLWTRDIKQGAGERRQFRELIKVLEQHNPGLAARIIPLVPELGRWDDLFAFTDALNINAAMNLFADALRAGNGLAFKWAPREKSARKVQAAILRNYLGMSPKQYRKYLAGGTRVVEQLMASKQWDSINFSHVPSLASARYQKAFGRNAAERYSAYIHELKKPESKRDPRVKINASAVYPYDVVKSVKTGNVAVADEQWKALPNYVGNHKILPMVDVSGSMHDYTNPSSLDVAVSLGLYLSERNTSAFKDLFLTFSGKPEFVKTSGTLSQRIKQMQTANWQMNTNIVSAFDSILRLAVNNRVPQSDMPETLLILSDMQFDAATSSRSYYYRSDDAGPKWSNDVMSIVRSKYAQAGYQMPKLVFWNLRATDNTPVRFDETGTALISGKSPAIMKSVLADDLETYTPYSVMLQTLMSERYNF